MTYLVSATSRSFYNENKKNIILLEEIYYLSYSNLLLRINSILRTFESFYMYHIEFFKITDTEFEISDVFSD